MCREAHEVGLRLKSQLAQEIGPVGFDRARTNGETLADLGIRQALGGELKNLALARCEQIVPIREAFGIGGARIGIERSAGQWARSESAGPR